MIVQAAPLKRHHQSEKSRQRASLAAIRSRPSIRRRGDIFDELSASPRKTNDGDSSNRRARKIRDDSPPFSAPATERGRERDRFPPFLPAELQFLDSRSIFPSSPLFCPDPQLSIPRFQYRGFATFLRIDSARLLSRVYMQGEDICRGFGSRDRFSLFWRRASFGISFEPGRGKEPSLI